MWSLLVHLKQHIRVVALLEDTVRTASENLPNCRWNLKLKLRSVSKLTALADTFRGDVPVGRSWHVFLHGTSKQFPKPVKVPRKYWNSFVFPTGRLSRQSIRSVSVLPVHFWRTQDSFAASGLYLRKRQCTFSSMSMSSDLNWWQLPQLPSDESFVEADMSETHPSNVLQSFHQRPSNFWRAVEGMRSLT